MRVATGCAWLVLLATTSVEAQRVIGCDGTLRGESIYLCLGADEGEAALLEELDRRPTTDVVRLIAELHLTDAGDKLKALLRDDATDEFLKADIAVALLALGDTSIVDELLALSGQWEDGPGSAWESLTAALAAGGHANAYALGLLQRIEGPVRGGRDETHLLWALPILVEANSTRALRTLQTLTEGEQAREIIHAPMMAARIRLGDTVLHRAMRARLEVRNSPVPVQPHHYWGALDDPADTVALLRGIRRHSGREAVAAYRAVNRMVVAHQASELQALHRGLNELTEHVESEVNGRRGLGELTYHHMALARLGEGASRRRLVEIAGLDETAENVVIATLAAVELAGPAGRRAAEEVFVRSSAGLAGPDASPAAELMSRVGGRDSGHDERMKLVDRLAEDGNHHGWVLALMDRHPRVRRRALHWFSRKRPAAACELVTARAAEREAAEDGVQFGLLALTVLGDDCEDRVERLASQRGVRNITKGMAVEVLAMMGSDAVPDLDARYRHHRWMRASIERARAIRDQLEAD